MSFAPGEVVVLCNLPPEFVRHNGELATVLYRDEHLKGEYYVIESPSLRRARPTVREFVSHRRHLRKLPRPPDWRDLADPRRLPIEDKALELST